MAREIDRAELLTRLDVGEDRDAEIVVYCSSDTCQGSALAASLLEGRGFTNILRYTAGQADWIDAGLPTEPTPD